MNIDLRLPFSLASSDLGHKFVCIEDAVGETVAYHYDPAPTTRAQFAYIVRAVNSHADLIEALSEAEQLVEHLRHYTTSAESAAAFVVAEKIRAALSRARGEG